MLSKKLNGFIIEFLYKKCSTYGNPPPHQCTPMRARASALVDGHVVFALKYMGRSSGLIEVTWHFRRRFPQQFVPKKIVRRNMFYENFLPCFVCGGSSEENLFIVFRIFYRSNVAGEKPASGSGGKSLNS